MDNNPNIKHKFELAGLGIAPFHFVRLYESKYCACPGAPVQPGTSCDYCGTGIMQVFEIADSAGKKFKVGCECVKKTDDAGLIDVVKRAASRRRAELKNAARVQRQARLRELFTVHKDTLALRSHPNKYFAEKSKTYADYVEYMLFNGGDAFKKDLLKELESLEAK